MAFAATLVGLAAAPGNLRVMQHALECGPDFEAEMAGLAAVHGDIYARAISERGDVRRRRSPGAKPVIAGE
jgi:hypothetical protein